MKRNPLTKIVEASLVDKNGLKNLMLLLIYPTVLGANIYDVFNLLIKAFMGKEIGGFLADGDAWNIISKLLLVVGLLAFYCFDFLYSYFTKEFRVLYFIFDIIILVGLTISFKSINTDNVNVPDYHTIVCSFMIFMIFYFYWDYNEMVDKSSGITEEEKRFYKKMVTWERAAFIFFGVIYVLQAFYLANFLTPILSIIVILAITIWFSFLIREKKSYIEIYKLSEVLEKYKDDSKTEKL